MSKGLDDVTFEEWTESARQFAERMKNTSVEVRLLGEERKEYMNRIESINRAFGDDAAAERQRATDNVVVKDSGKREEFFTGARRDTQEGKGRYDLLQPRAIHLVARQLQEGAKKYGDRNWETGIPIGRYMDSALRHTFNYLSGKTDEDHLVAAAWNLLSAIETRERVREGLLPQELANIGAPIGAGE